MPSQQPQQASPAQQPQQQPQGMPPQNDPRMSAAMDVVESNIPEYLNPTDALMKRNQAAELAQQAMALMASADRQTAMSQQPPTPPTIAEQVDQRAMEGISGIAQRLSPGMQQRGQQVQQAQARKMLSGGMPSMGAPNMARMASGGIVGYQQGGNVSAPPVPTMGAVPKSAVGDAQIKQFAAEYMAIKGSIANAQTPEGKMQAQQLLQDLRTQMGNEQGAVMQYIDSTKGSIAAPGMANGGIVGYRPGGGVKGYAGPNGSLVTNDSGLPPEVTQSMDFLRRIRALQDQLIKPDRKRSALDRNYGQLTAAERESNAKINAQIDLLKAGRTQPATPTVTPGVGTQYDPTGKETEGLSYGRGEDTPAQNSINDIISKIADVKYPEVTSSALRVPIKEAGLGNISRAPEAERLAEESRKQTQAEAVYAMSPEMKAAYAADRTKRDEYYTAQLDPKRQRDQKINALLAGLATPGGIAKSGIAALQGTTAVDDTALEMQRRRAEEDFASTKEQAGIEREGRVNAFDASTTAGQSAFERASAAVNQASQSLSQIASSEETREQAMAIQQYTIETGNLQLQLNELVRQQNLAEADKTRMRYIVADLQDSQRDIDSNISNLQNSMLAMEEPEKVRARELIEAEKVRKAGIQRQIEETFRRIGFPTAGSPPSGSASSGSGATPKAPTGFVPD
jgi:hypothetical protein